ncbi:aminopeptidase N [Rhizobiales bacterium]|uniref:aminopeptidase N n=1 Tax=Hongsoonwoonella zoysiae TaxID=2821844 RepID=UPI00155F6D18|nr:aminopeptidase N [Hongsoonwoonella zoysiae]NRG19368.1 aminopeptidase N [Hongsoonwoonella zoysiae]
MRTETAGGVRLEDYQPAPYTIDRVDLDIRLAPKATRVSARLSIRRSDNTAPGTPLVLDGDGLKLAGLLLDGSALTFQDYSASPDRLEISTPPSGPFVLDISTELDPDANTKLMGLYRSQGTYCTQCEAEGFRRITYFLDRPDVLAIYSTRIEARKAEAPVLLGNGNLVEAGEIEGTDRHFAIWHDPHPKPSYLFALVAGDLARVPGEFTTASGRRVELGIYVEHGNEGQCGWALDSLKRSMRWDEQAFGREYDLDVFNIVAVSDFNMGAMENKGLNIFNDKYILADPDTATDQDYANIEAVIAHEYFHNWTGNRITCRDWFQLCLKEGLTVFRDQEFSADERSRPVKRISDVRLLKSHQFPEDAGPLAHPVRPRFYQEINNFYTATVYEKGAEVVRMLKTLLGDRAFRAGMDLFFERHDGEATTVEAFLECFRTASGEDLEQFALWYEQAGTPTVAVKSHYDAEAKVFTLSFNQSIPPTPRQSDKKPMTIPVRFALVGKDGSDLAYEAISGAEAKGDVLKLQAPEHTVTFSGIGERPIPSLFRGFSAPVILESDLSEEDYLFLAGKDGDPFNRWQALQSVALSSLVTGTNAAVKDSTIEVDDLLIHALGAVAEDESLDPAFRALALQLPSEADIAREIGSNVDPDAVASARDHLRKAVAQENGTSFARIYDSLSIDGPYRPDAASAGMRAFRNTLLEYLAHSGIEGEAERVRAHFRDADNMTDRLAGLTQLVHARLEGADEALASYYERHGTHPLAIDKWLTVQATAGHPDTLDKVKALTAHPAFSFANPNRLRALVGAFATGNQTQFNRIDGAGFNFVADTVLALDDKNPQVAARLLSAFRSWRALEATRRILAENALRRVTEKPNLSRDVKDIAERSLQ